jgi:hypothetical protein
MRRANIDDYFYEIYLDVIIYGETAITREASIIEGS